MPPVLPLAIPAERLELDCAAGRISYYRSALQGACDLPPLLLVHSVNAAGSAADVAPLFEHFRASRSVYAPDLPGFGFSDRSERAYTPRLMTDAVLALVEVMRREHGGVAVDALGVSLASEYVARAQSEVPNSIHRIALVSPTGFSGSRRRYGAPGADLGQAWLYKAFTWPFWSDSIFRNLTRPGVIRYFLQRTWGAKKIDEALWHYDVLTTQQPGAKNAPLYFVSAYLFSADINTLYESLDCPVWVSMATRGDFTDYRGRTTLQDKPNWQFHAIEGGALPFFENLTAFTNALSLFLSNDA
jgi:pimeloyl-ACP methyl ester carboxylesterase